ncbi:MAG TPA: ABC transporter permease [Longimicrobiales bacterium]|nr:ABC transporter permease [Longimicrobiales bacterium]
MERAAFLRQFLEDLRTQRLRTALTVFGITWGTVAVVVLLAFGVGLQRQMQINARGIGERIVIVFGGRTTKSFQGFPKGREIELREEDVALLVRQVPGIERISPEYSSRSRPIRRGTASSNANVTGVYPAFAEMRNVFPEPGGRFLDELDEAGRRRVAFLGDELKTLLFADQDAVGQQVLIGDVPFTVIGVMRKKTQNSSYNGRDKDRVFIPASTFRAIYGTTGLNDIVYQPADPMLSKATARSVYQVLGRKHKFDAADEDALRVWDTNETMQFFKYLFTGFNVFLGVVGSFTLLVGGIGVANIMYIVVRERTREIGIKRSLGARRRDIMAMFFGETFLLVGAGASLGMAISLALVKIGGMLPLQDSVGVPVLSPLVLTATVVLLGAIAFLAGVFPARKAAHLDPVDCLRQ